MEEFGTYEYALFHRCNWVNPDSYGEVTYTGRYCVITGIGEAEEGKRFVSAMYAVGNGAVLPLGKSVARYWAESVDFAILNHERLLDQADAMDSLEFVYGA